jgi:sulfopyruvate decarboxylase alpha subunit
MTMVNEIGAQTPTWHSVLHNVLVENDVSLITYVPDNVLRPLIGSIHGDPFFDAFCVTREEEGLGIVSGAWMGGKRGALLMQTSGFATLPNALASLAVAFQIPVLLIVSERGTLGEFNPGQAIVCRTMRPVLDSLGVEHHVCARLDELEFIADRTIKQALATRAPATLILSPLLTGGKAVKS